MQNTVNVRLQQAYKAEADWKSSDPVGKKGEIMISSDKNGMFKVGNGTSKWSELNYNNASYASSAGSVAWGNVSGKPSSMPASDVYAWAKASSKPSYSWSEIGSKPSTFTPAAHTHSQYYDSNTSRAANTILAAPNGSDGNATFRKLVASDIPSLNYLPLGGGTITGDLKVNSKITTSSIELYDATPYIDFHFDGNSGDYTSRIIENTSGVLNINGATFTNGGAIWSKWITVDGSISVTQAGSFGSGVACANESRFYVNSYTDPLAGTTCAIKGTGIIATNGSIYSTGIGSGTEAQIHVKNDSRDAYLCASSSGRAGIYDTKHGWIIFNDNDCRTTYIQECKVYNGKVTAKADSTSWLVGASPGGASFESINITDGALVPIWRCRTVDGAWVGASYASDPGFRIYYANNARLKAQTDNGTDARFTFGASGIMYATSFSNTSDERKKDVIDFLSDTLPSSYKNFFMKLRPFTFKWNDNLLDKKSHYGVGAQSVYQAALDCGFTDDDLGFIHKGKELPGTSIPWSVSYSEFIPLNIAVTQDHETRIEKLERENEELKQQIKEMKGLTA